MNRLWWIVALALWLGMAAGQALPAGDDDWDQDFWTFDDRPLPEPLSYPDWFKLSFLDFRDDVLEAMEAGKRGLIIYFGQKDCAYCKALLEKDFGKPDIAAYTRRYFDVVAVDIHGDRSVVDIEGREATEREFAARYGINFTPTLVFYDVGAKEVFRLQGFYPPYKFRAALEYVADAHYLEESFRDYLARADVPLSFAEGELNIDPLFPSPPHVLDRSRLPGERPLIVFFEQPDCHACDILHSGPLREPAIRRRLARFDLAQLDIWADTPVITPRGKRTTARAWAEDLGLFYTPTLLFFDKRGREILRVDSVIQFYRLRNLLDYVLSGGYRDYPSFQQWRARGRR
ncbi:thioredoxin fold domain-containing protein [Thiohalobacter sp. IOR34]|uniref:thioredoxin family protein n=1 Tax=Thiohalobacter sp. IOR34 TaxID=3057176 RepID=UPI0025AF45C5|nr:thioredoxin fold domain-containing protein [Thiohalobacter sp. IOR34]WJW75989.1 thioredoxin fold domain-containing protein [Thiohalobacter sp. IOR34]